LRTFHAPHGMRALQSRTPDLATLQPLHQVNQTHLPLSWPRCLLLSECAVVYSPIVPQGLNPGLAIAEIKKMLASHNSDAVAVPKPKLNAASA